MNQSRRAVAISIVAAATVLAGCSTDRLAGPSTASTDGASAVYGSYSNQLSLLPTLSGSTSTKQALLWTNSRSKSISRSFTITRAEGAEFYFSDTDLKILVPPDAISATTLKISVTVLAGSAVAYEFEPAGTKFLRPLLMIQDLDKTTYAKNKSWALLGAGYFSDISHVDPKSGKTLVQETLPAVLAGSTVMWSAWHFSGYMVSMD